VPKTPSDRQKAYAKKKLAQGYRRWSRLVPGTIADELDEFYKARILAYKIRLRNLGILPPKKED
jgi:hypothetical protein